MKNYNTKSRIAGILKLTTIFLLTLILFACASTPDPETADAPAAEGEASASATESEASTTTSGAESASSDSGTTTTQAAASPAEPAVEPEEIKPPKIVESCKDEPYSKYEKQARESIAKGLEATKAGQFGVGFRDVAEHNKWSKIHNSLFKSVNDACNELASCAKEHKKDKDTECVAQAKTFATWQNLAKSFAGKAKSVETTEPPIICSLEPSLSDPADCFHGLAKNITEVCDSSQCKEVSDCWRTVGFLDAAIIQARTSCGFVHEGLKNCRGYTEATKRREDKFSQCKDLQDRIDISPFPVL